MYIKRYLEEKILKINRTFKVLFLGGPRQVGKTTLLLHLAKSLKFNYVTLDDLTARNLAKKDPDLFLQKFQAPLLIDEIQYAPELFPYIKIRVDKSNKNGQYWITGSQQFSIMKNVQESLAGRVAILQLLGFSLAEKNNIKKTKSPFLPGSNLCKNQKKNIKEIFNFIFKGSFPIVWQKNSPDIETFYSSYLQTYIDRDLRTLFNITKTSEFHTFIQLCAARTGQILNYSNLARDARISVHAVKEWLSILESSMQIYILKPYYKNISNRLIKSPKLYFLDTGFASYLTSWKSPETLMNGAMAGAFFETFVVSEIIKSYLYRGEEAPIYYFRDKEGHEVDIILEREGKVHPIEIKMTSLINHHDLKGINFLRNKTSELSKGAIISMSQEQIPLDKHNEIIPVGMIS